MGVAGFTKFQTLEEICTTVRRAQANFPSQQASYSITIDRYLIQALIEATFDNTSTLMAQGEDKGPATARLVAESEIEGGIECFDAHSQYVVLGRNEYEALPFH